MQHNAAFLQGMRCLLRLKHSQGREIHDKLEISICDPLTQRVTYLLHQYVWENPSEYKGLNKCWNVKKSLLYKKKNLFSYRQGPIDDMKRTARKSCWSGRPEMRDLIDRHEDTELEPPHRGGARHHSGPGPHGSPGPRGGPGPHRGRGQNTRYSGDNRQPHPFRDRSYNGRERDNDNRNNDRIRDSEFVNDRDRISETNRNIYRHDDRRSGTYKSDFHSNKEPFRKNEQSKNHRSRSRDRDSRRSGSRDSRRRSRSRDFKRRSRSRDLSRRSKSRDSKRSSSRDSRRSKSRDIESSGKNQIKSMVVNKLKKDDQSSDLSSQESSPMRSWKNERFKDSRNKKPIASELKNQSSIICISSKDDLKKSKAVNDKRLDDDILMNNEIRSDGTSPFNNDAPEIIVTVQCDSLEKPKKKPFERRVSKEEEIKDKAEKTNDSSSKQDEMKKCDQTFPKSNFAAAESEITDTRTEISKSNDKVLKDRENQSSEQDTIVKKSQVTSSKSAKVTNTQEVKRKSISESTQSEKSKMSDPGITMNVKSVDKSKVVQETSGSSSNNCSKSENSDLNISTNLNPKNSFKDQRRSSSDYNKAKLCENSTVNSSKTSDQKQTAWSLSSKNHQNKENGENTNKAEERLVVKHKEPNIISDTVKTSLKHGTRLKTDNGNQSAKTMEAKMTGKVKIDISENVAPVITNNKPDNKRSLDSQSLDRLKKEISGLGVKPRRKSVEFDKHMGINNESGNFERKLESISNKTTFNNTVDANENNKKVTELLPNNSEVDKETDRSEIRIRRKSGKESLLSNNSEVETDRSEIRIRRKSGKEPLQPADNRSVSIDEPNQPKSDKLSHQMPSENVTFDLVGQILRAGEKREKRRNSGNHSSSVKPTVESNDMKSTSSKSTIITSTPLKEAKQTDSKVKGTENVIDENATNGETELPSFVQVCLDRSQSVCDRVNTFEKLDKENPELLFKKNVPRKSLFLETNKKSMKNLSSLRGQMDLNAKPVTKPSLFASKFTHKKDTVVSNPSVQDVPLPENEKPRSSEKMLKIRSGASNQIKLMKTNQPSSWKDKNKKQDFSPKKKNLFSKKKRDRSPLLHRKLNKSQDALKNKSPNASVGQARTNIFESLSKNFVPSAHEKKKDGLSVKNVDKHHVKRTAKENPKTGSANEKLKPSGNVQTQQDKDKPNGHQPKSRSKIETSQSDQPKSLSDIEKSLNDQAMSLSHIEKSLRDHPKIRSNIEKSQSDQPKSPTLETSSLESARISKDKTKHILKASHTNLPSCIVPLGKDALKRRASCERKMETTSVSVGIENKPQTTEDCLNASSNLTLNSKKMERAAMTAGEIAECDENSNEKTNSDIISQELSQQSDSSIDTLTCQAVIEECLNEMTRPSSASTADLCSNREQTGKSEDNIMNVDKSENNDGENLQTPKHKQDGMNIVDQTHTKDKTCDNDNSKVPSVITDDDIEDDDFCLIDINPYTTHAKAVIADSKVSECSSNDATKDNTNDLYDDKAVPVIESMTENSSNFAEEMYEPHTSDISDDEDAAEYETRKRTCNMTIKYCDDRVFIESNEQAINQRINEKNTPVDHIQDKGESSTCNVNNVRNKVVSVPDDSNKRNKVASVTNDNSERNKVTSACNDSNEVNKVASVSNDNSERNNVASACNDSSERNKVASVSNDNSGRNKVASVSNDNSGRSKVASVPNDKNERNKVASVPNDKSEQNKVASACNDSSERNKVAFVPNENSGRNKVDPVPNDDSEQNKVAYACNDNSEGNKLASVRNSPSINTREKSDNQKLCKRKNSVTSSAESPEDSVQPKKIKVDNEAYTPDKTHDVKNEQSFKKQLKFKSDSPMKLTPRKRNYADILASASKGFDEPASPDNKSSDKEDKQSVKNGKLKRKLSKDEIENDSDLGTTESPSKKKRTDHKDVESPKDRKKEMKKALEKAKMTIKVPVNNGKKRLSTSDSSCLPISESYSKALPMEHDALPMEKEAVLRGKEAVPMEKEICEESTAILEQTNEVVVSEHQDPNSPDSVSSDDKALETPPVQLSECSVESSIPVLKNGFNVSHTLTLKDLRRVTTIGHLDPQRVYSGQRCILCQVCMNYFTPLQFTFHHDSSSIVCNIDGEKSMRNSYHPEHPNIIHWNEEAGKIWDEFEKIFEREKR